MKPEEEQAPEPRNSNSNRPTEISVAQIGLVGTLVVALISLIGVVVNAYFSNQAAQAPLLIAIHATQTAEARLLPIQVPSVTSIAQIPDNTPTPLADTPTAPAPTFPTVVDQPIVQLVSGLSPDVVEAVQTAASALLDLGQKMPLYMRDSFDSNDYFWSVFQDTYEHGIECGAAIKDGKYDITLRSTATSGPAWCIPYAPRRASNFFLSFDTQLVGNRNTDILLDYRYSDDNNFYFLILNQQTQTMSLGSRLNGVDGWLIQSAFVPTIQKDGANKITLIALNDAHAIYINDQLVAMISKELNHTEGQLRLGIRLNEADQSEELLVDDFELRGY